MLMSILLFVGILSSYAQYTTTTCVPGSTVYVPQLSVCYNSATECPGNVISGNAYYNWGIIATTSGNVKFCTNYNVDNCTPNCDKCKSYATNQCLICAGGTTRTSITRTPSQVMSLLAESCPCKAGFQEASPQTANCIQCITNCQTCPNTSTCTTCNSGYYLNASSTCSICVAPCSTCQTITQCLSCVGSNISLSGTQCLCNSGYYWNSSVCSVCTNACLTCVTTSSQCTSCAAGMYLTSNQCLFCNSNCVTCSGTANNCLSCSSGLFKILNNNQCICQNGYYGTTVCAQCDSKCATCQNSPTYCLTCSDINSTLSNNSCPCNNGYYWNGTSCQTCQWPCATCQTTSLTCLTCSDANSQLSGSTCNCNNGYYVSGNQCLQCQNLCLNCSSLTACLSCRDINSTLSGTTCNCNSGYYLSSNSCLQCQLPCQNCQTTASTCVSCADSHSTLSGNTCPCNNGYYWNGTSCQICQWPCATCQTTSLTCLTCQDSNSHKQGTTCICNNGYYLSSNSCLQCQLPCQNCQTTASTCLSCVDPHSTLNGNTCPCNTGYYWNGTSCQTCQWPCATCQTTSLTCLSCQDINSHLQGSTCNCNDGYYVQGNQCLQCQNLCQNCSSLTACLSCRDINSSLNGTTCSCNSGYYLQLNQCSQCQFPCLTCSSSPSICLSCTDPNSTLNGSTCNCNFSYYLQSQQCFQCQFPCLTCTSDSICLTCLDSNSQLDGSTCKCNDGFYLNGNMCSQCQSPCLNCISLGSCLSCQVGYYLDGNQCLKCQYPCETCLSSSICLSCYNDLQGLAIQQGEYFYLENTQCYACKPPCQLCSSETYCLTCINADYLQINKGQCICDLGYYLENMKCLNCPPLCSQCSSEDKCQTCISNAILDPESMCQCQVGYFQKDSICQKCSRKCEKCVNQFDNCTKCDEKSNLILRNGQCQCKPGYYQDLFERCQECNLSSQNKNCFTKQIANSTFCDDGNYISRDGCSNNQIDNNYQCFKLYNQLDLCLELPANCLQIQQQNDCVICKDGYFLDQRLCLQCSDLCLTCNTKFQCKTCKYQIDRITKQCIYCNQGYYFDNFQCTSLCGDGIKTDEEQCDDGNLLDNDGCNKHCQIVEGYDCAATNSLSYCTKLNYPMPTIEIVQQAIKSPDKLFVKISYQQQIQAANLELERDLIFNIEDLDQQQYSVTMKNVIQDQYLVQIDVEIQLKKSLPQKTKMAIRFNTKQFRTQTNLTQQEQIFDIELPQFQVITATQKQVTEIQGQVKDIILISSGTIVLVSFLLGGLQLLIDFIDLIQFLSYLSYINTQYPYNYQQFMAILQYGQLSQLFNQFDISFINSFRKELASLQSDDQVVGYVPIKMQLDGYKPQILINIPSILVVWFLLFVQYILSIITLRLINKFQLNHLKFRSKTSIKLFSMKIKQSLVRQNSQNVNLFFYSSIYKSIMATSYDTFFFISLSLANFTLYEQSLDVFLNQSLTLAIIIIYLRIIYYAWNIISSRNLSGSYYKQKIGSLIEGLKIKNSSRYYNLWQILKKGIFMYSLVNLYQDALFQIIVLIFLNGLDLVYLVNYKVYLDKIDYFRTISTQCQMLLHQILIAVLVLDDFLSIFTPYYKEFTGWFLIANIQLLMIKQLFIYIYTQRKLYIKLFQLIQKLIDQFLKKLLKEDVKSLSRIKQPKLQKNKVKRFPLQQLPI